MWGRGGYASLMSFFRSIKCSLKELVTFPSWEVLSKFWKEYILSEIRFLWNGNPGRLSGVVMDPIKFIPLYLKRFLMRREMEGHLPPAGNYEIKIKVGVVSFSLLAYRFFL